MSFSQKTIDFLLENRLNDSKSWFNAHKDEYEKYVREPFKEFTSALLPRMQEMDELITSVRVSRIYRDARFSKGGSVFRENMWCTFGRTRELYKALPSFYFDISGRGFEYGCGYYTASSESMDNMRSLILADSPYFAAAREAYGKQDIFELYGDMYKRSKFPGRSEEERFWLDRKTIGLSSLCTDREILFSDKLCEKVADDFERILPVYDFFMKAEEL